MEHEARARRATDASTLDGETNSFIYGETGSEPVASPPSTTTSAAAADATTLVDGGGASETAASALSLPPLAAPVAAGALLQAARSEGINEESKEEGKEDRADETKTREQLEKTPPPPPPLTDLTAADEEESEDEESDFAVTNSVSVCFAELVKGDDIDQMGERVYRALTLTFDYQNKKGQNDTTSITFRAGEIIRNADNKLLLILAFISRKGTDPQLLLNGTYIVCIDINKHHAVMKGINENVKATIRNNRLEGAEKRNFEVSIIDCLEKQSLTIADLLCSTEFHCVSPTSVDELFSLHYISRFPRSYLESSIIVAFESGRPHCLVKLEADIDHDPEPKEYECSGILLACVYCLEKGKIQEPRTTQQDYKITSSMELAYQRSYFNDASTEKVTFKKAEDKPTTAKKKRGENKGADSAEGFYYSYGQGLRGANKAAYHQQQKAAAAGTASGLVAGSEGEDSSGKPDKITAGKQNKRQTKPKGNNKTAKDICAMVPRCRRVACREYRKQGSSKRMPLCEAHYQSIVDQEIKEAMQEEERLRRVKQDKEDKKRNLQGALPLTQQSSSIETRVLCEVNDLKDQLKRQNFLIESLKHQASTKPREQQYVPKAPQSTAEIISELTPLLTTLFDLVPKPERATTIAERRKEDLELVNQTIAQQQDSMKFAQELNQSSLSNFINANHGNLQVGSHNRFSDGFAEKQQEMQLALKRQQLEVEAKQLELMLAAKKTADSALTHQNYAIPIAAPYGGQGFTSSMLPPNVKGAGTNSADLSREQSSNQLQQHNMGEPSGDCRTNLGKDRGKDRDGGRDRDRGRSSDSDRSRDQDRGRARGKDRGKDRDGGRARGRSRNRSSDGDNKRRREKRSVTRSVSRD